MELFDQVPLRLRDGGHHREQSGAGREQEGGGQGRRRPHIRLREHQKGHPGTTNLFYVTHMFLFAKLSKKMTIIQAFDRTKSAKSFS